MHHFGSSLSASLACSFITMFISSSHLLVILLSLALCPHDACRQTLASQRWSDFPRYIVPIASHRTVTRSACIGRLLMTEHQVSPGVLPVETITQATFMSHDVHKIPCHVRVRQERPEGRIMGCGRAVFLFCHCGSCMDETGTLYHTDTPEIQVHAPRPVAVTACHTAGPHPCVCARKSRNVPFSSTLTRRSRSCQSR